MKHRNSTDHMTIFDRIAFAFAGGVFGALTLAAYALLVLVFGGPIMGIGFLFLSPFGLAFIVVCALAGAFLRTDQLVSIFLFLWGTSDAWESPRVQMLAKIFIFTGLSALLVLALGRGLA